MDILLVDLITGDHSIPYASSIKRQLETKDAVSRVDFLTLAGDDRLDMNNYFEENDGIYFIQHDYEGGSPGYNDSIIDPFEKMIDFIKQGPYDVVHLLQVDNLLVESSIVLNFTNDLPPIVAQINGAFFGTKETEWMPDIRKHLSKMLSSPLQPIVKAGLTRGKTRRMVKDVSLRRCMEDGVFENLLVHTNAAKEYVSDLGNYTTPVTVVPEPSTVDSPELSKKTARQRLGIDPEDTVLLFFGGLRKEKGIYQLLQSLKKYNGPKFTLLVAGPERHVGEEDFQKIKDKIIPSLSTDIRYIYDSEQYFIAADGVVCPYLEEFGEERTSHVFQEAVKLKRPVICPSFGSFKSRLENYNLGLLYSPNTAEALSEAISDFVNSPEQYYSIDDMSKFSEEHSFGNLCSTLMDIYKNSL